MKSYPIDPFPFKANDRAEAAKQGWVQRKVRLQTRREAVVELWQQGLSTANIAATLGLTFGVVKSDVEVVRKINPDAVPRGGPLMRRIVAARTAKLQKKACRITRRAEAIASGAITYIGQPCKFGHQERRTSNKKCVRCDIAEKRVDAASGYSNAYHTWWRRTRDPHRIRQRQWEATYRTRHALQLERKAQERRAIRQNTINLLYGGK